LPETVYRKFLQVTRFAQPYPYLQKFPSVALDQRFPHLFEPLPKSR